nr:HNH endonuclease [Clostridia bacterium]
ENYNTGKHFVWKLRYELVEAIEELNLFSPEIPTENEKLESTNIDVITPEGKKTASYVTKYERSSKNRRAAIKSHGTVCQICGFDFEKTYGELGKGFIEVHHIKPLYSNEDEVIPDPDKDLICVCANCHVMFHRKKDRVPSPQQLKNIIKNNKIRKETKQ